MIPIFPARTGTETDAAVVFAHRERRGAVLGKQARHALPPLRDASEAPPLSFL